MGNGGYTLHCECLTWGDKARLAYCDPILLQEKLLLHCILPRIPYSFFGAPTALPEPGLRFSLVFRADPGREDVLLRIARPTKLDFTQNPGKVMDDITFVRSHWWLVSEGFSLSTANSDVQKLPATLYHRIADSLAYAA